MNGQTLNGLEADVTRVIRFRIHRDGAVYGPLPLWSGYHRQPRRRVIADDLAAFLALDEMRSKYFDGLSPVHAAVFRFSMLSDCVESVRKKLESELCEYFPPRRRWWEFWKRDQSNGLLTRADSPRLFYP